MEMGLTAIKANACGYSELDRLGFGALTAWVSGLEDALGSGDVTVTFSLEV